MVTSELVVFALTDKNGSPYDTSPSRGAESESDDAEDPPELDEGGINALVGIDAVTADAIGVILEEDESTASGGVGPGADEDSEEDMRLLARALVG